jgi:predicted negative regulator of RcsB-dependent stress response
MDTIFSKEGIGIIAIFLLGLIIGFSWRNPRDSHLLEQVDSLKAINEQLKTEISKRNNLLDSIDKQYEKDSAIITNQSFDDDYDFFTNYLKR